MTPLKKSLYRHASSLLFKGVSFADRNLWMPAQISETINFRARWKELKSPKKGRTAKLWIHGASVGELEDLAAFFLSPSSLASAGLIAGDVVVTSASISAKSRLEKWREEHAFLYCGPLPPDTKTDAAEFLAAFKPQNILLSHNDFWPNLFLQWRASKFAKNFYWYFKPKTFTKFRLELFQALRPIHLGRSNSSQDAHVFDDFSVVGNLRLDRILSRIKAAAEIPHVLDEWNAAPKPSQPSIIVGSCRLEDAKLIAQLSEEYFKLYHWVIVPHHTDSIGEIAQINQMLGDKCHVIVAQGILVEAYRNFDLAWVGGGFSPSGSHNTLESIAWGVPTICGPNLKPQIDAPVYVQSGVLKSFENLETIELFLRDKGWISMQSTCKAFAETLRTQESAVSKLIKTLKTGNL